MKPADVGGLSSTSKPVISGGARKRITDYQVRYPVRNRIAWGALIVLVVILAVVERQALGQTSVRYVSALTGILILAGLGQLMVVMVGGIDLSIPAVMVLSAAVLVHDSKGSNHSLIPAALTAIGICACVGVVNGLLVAILKLNPIIVTLATFGIVTGGVQKWTGTVFSLTGTVPSSLHRLSTAAVGPVSILIILGIGAGCLLRTYLTTTTLGRSTVAAGANPNAAKYLGIKVSAHIVSAYTVSAILAALAALLLSGFLVTPDTTIGQPYQLLTVVAAVLGGAILAGGPASISSLVAACAFLELFAQALAIRGVTAGVSEMLNGLVLVAAIASSTLLARVIRRPRAARTALADPRGV